MSRRSDEVREMRERDAISRAEDEQIARIHNIFIIATLLLTALFFAWLGWRSYRQPIEERAAYLEGRYDLDHETAMEYAAQGYGKTSAEYLATK